MGLIRLMIMGFRRMPFGLFCVNAKHTVWSKHRLATVSSNAKLAYQTFAKTEIHFTFLCASFRPKPCSHFQNLDNFDANCIKLYLSANSG